MIERLLYLNLNLRWPRGCSVSVWIWGDWEASLSQFKYEVIERLLYLGLNLGWLKGFSISIWIWGDWETSLSRLNLRWLRSFSISVQIWGDRKASLFRFEPRAIEWLLYLNLKLGWPRGFSILIWIWGDWEASLSRFKPRALPEKDQSLGLDFKWLMLYCSIILRCVILLLFPCFVLFFFKNWISSSKGKTIDFYEVLWEFFIIYFLKFVDGDLSFEDWVRRFFIFMKMCSWRFVIWRYVQEIFPFFMRMCSWRFVLWRFVQEIFPFEDLFMEIFSIFMKMCSWRFVLWRFIQEIFIFEDLFRRFFPLEIYSGDFSFWRFVHGDCSLCEDVFTEIYPLKIEV